MAQRGNDVVHRAIGEMLLCRVSAEVYERQHGDGWPTVTIGACYPANMGRQSVATTRNRDDPTIPKCLAQRRNMHCEIVLLYRQAGRGDHIAFAAPGVRIWTAASVSGGRFRSGTSYAVPFVTAAIAAALAEHPDHTREQLVADLAAQSGDLGEAGRDPTFGFGLIKAKGC